MDLRLTSNVLEIKHASKEDVVETLNALKRVIDFKISPNHPLVNPTLEGSILNEEIVDEPLSVPLEALKVKSEEDEVVEEILNVLAEPSNKMAYKKRLVFDTCSKCGSTFCQMLEIENRYIAPSISCKCGHSQYAYDLTKGSYECDCGQKGFFLMTPGVNVVKCKSCSKDFIMTMNSETNEYIGYPLDSNEIIRHDK